MPPPPAPVPASVAPPPNVYAPTTPPPSHRSQPFAAASGGPTLNAPPSQGQNAAWAPPPAWAGQPPAWQGYAAPPAQDWAPGVAAPQQWTGAPSAYPYAQQPPAYPHAWQRPSYPHAQAPPGAYVTHPLGPTNGVAIGGFVTSVASIWVLFMFSGLIAPLTLIASIVGMIVSHKGKVAVDRGTQVRHRAFGLAGFIVGIVGIALSLLAIAGWTLLFVLAESDTGGDGFGGELGPSLLTAPISLLL